MKFEILQENLNNALSSVCRILSTRPQLPILANVLITAKDGKIVLTTSNLETSMMIETGAKVLVDGDFTVPGRTLLEIISSLSAEKINLEVVEGSLKITSNSFTGKINGIMGSEYPKLSFETLVKSGFHWEITRGAFLEALRLTTFAAASDESRAVLTGILLKPNEDSLSFVSTDGFRLSIVKLDKVFLSPKKLTEPIIIPAHTLTELTRILGEKTLTKEDKALKIYLSPAENQICFDLGETKIISRLITGNFPDYEKIIPSNSTLQISISIEELSKAVRLSSVFARDSANIVKLHIAHLPDGEAGSKLHVSAAAAQLGENESEIDVSTKGEAKSDDFSIAFNYHYLLDLLAVVNGELTMELSDPTSPGLFRASSSKNFFHIIMPVRVQN